MAEKEKRRVRLEINGVVCGLITSESEAYMQSLASEVDSLIRNIQRSSPIITREAAAVTAALSFCDELKKANERIEELEVEAEISQEEKEELKAAPEKKHREQREWIERLENENAGLKTELSKKEEREASLEKELGQKNEELAGLLNEIKSSESEKTAPVAASADDAAVDDSAAQKPLRPKRESRRKNPLRYEDELEQQSFVSFFEKKS